MTTLLRFDAVTLRRGGRILFEDLSLDLAPGEAIQVAGPNGSGKSSLIRLAAGLLRAERGDVESDAPAFANDHVALDRERPLGRALAFWCGSARDAMAALGIEHLGQVPVRLLSSGQLKRATLARVAGSGARLWLLDEPLNGLDEEGTERLFALIAKHRAEGGGVLAASHQLLSGDWRRVELGT